MDWSFMDKVGLLTIFVFCKYWRIFIVAIPLALIGLGYWLGA